MSTTNALGYILPIEDLSMSQKFGGNVMNPLTATAVGGTNVAADGTATTAQILNGYLSVGVGGGAPYTTVLPTGTIFSTAVAAITGVTPAIGTKISCRVNNTVAQAMTWTGAAGMVVVGAVVTLAASSATQAVFVCLGANSWKTYLQTNA